MTSDIKSIAAVSVLSVASSETSSTVSSETPDSWSPTSWTATEVHEQRVAYRNHDGLIDACSRIERLPELVNCQTIEAVRGHFAAAARGEAFILIGGDCAENFADVQESIIAEKYNLLRDQASLIEAAIHAPVHILGRMAGQYAKPRSQVMETLQGGQVVHAFRGQNVNGFGIEERDPDPDRLLHGYLYAAATLNCLSRISESARRPVWTCHEALHLELETAQTKERYNTSAAFLWTGERTGQLNGAHLEYLHGIKNPLGVKIGPSATPEKVLGILEKFCWRHPSEEGRVTLITRFGANNVERVLPPLVQAVQESPFQVVWMSDPCHGNTISVDGVKTRVVTTMLEEVKKTIKILRSHGTDLGGLHLEQTGEAVYECIPDSTGECSPPEKNERYRTLCDPRLSGEQARILVREVAGLLGQGRPKNAARQRSWPPQFSAIMDTTIRKVNGVLGSPKRVPVA